MTRCTRPMFVLVFLLMIASAALAQTQQQTDEGTVVSSSRSTLLVKTASGEYKLFELTSDTTRPRVLAVGAAVKVTSNPSAAGTSAVATVVEVTAAAPAGAKPQTDENVPPALRRVEHSIQRQASKYRLGVRAGAALDPEQVMIGVHGQFGPLFNANTYARPNIELMFGEVTDIVAINLEGIYRLPGTLRGSRWQFYFGAGPAFNFVKKGFEDQTEDFSFDDFDLDIGLNLIAGVQAQGVFVELKATAYAEPSIRFILGYSF